MVSAHVCNCICLCAFVCPSVFLKEGVLKRHVGYMALFFCSVYFLLHYLHVLFLPTSLVNDKRFILCLNYSARL